MSTLLDLIKAQKQAVKGPCSITIMRLVYNHMIVTSFCLFNNNTTTTTTASDRTIFGARQKRKEFLSFFAGYNMSNPYEQSYDPAMHEPMPQQSNSNGSEDHYGSYTQQPTIANGGAVYGNTPRQEDHLTDPYNHHTSSAAPQKSVGWAEDNLIHENEPLESYPLDQVTYQEQETYQEQQPPHQVAENGYGMMGPQQDSYSNIQQHTNSIVEDYQLQSDYYQNYQQQQQSLYNFGGGRKTFLLIRILGSRQMLYYSFIVSIKAGLILDAC